MIETTKDILFVLFAFVGIIVITLNIIGMVVMGYARRLQDKIEYILTKSYESHSKEDE